MKKLLFIVAVVLLLNGCSSLQLQSKPEASQQNTDQTVQTPTQKESAINFTTSYLPSGWIIEDSIFYSPEMYNAREGGPYSLRITINEKFSSIDGYLEDKASCTIDKTDFKINNYQAVRFTDSCTYSKPKMIILQMDENLVEAFSYSFSEESNEIEKILETLETLEIKNK